MLCKDYPVAVFLVGEMADHPTDAVHRHQAADGVFFGDTLQAADELAAGKA
jgi:hypothetical protein